MPLSSHAQVSGDDTFACLNQGGQTVTIDKTYGFDRLDARGDYGNNTKIVAGKSLWHTRQRPDPEDNLYPVLIGGGASGLCWTGGIVEGKNSNHYNPSTGKGWFWAEFYGAGNSTAFGAENAPGVIIDGFRAHNTGDGVRIQKNADNFLVHNTWVSHANDDCTENDGHQSGTYRDNLFECGMAALSSRSNSDRPAKNEVVRIEDNLVRMEAFMTKEGDSKRRFGDYRPGHGQFFKWRGAENVEGPGPMLELHNNLFVTDDKIYLGESQWETFYGTPLNRLKSCSGNTVVWLGSGSYPGNFPSNCVKIVTGQAGIDLWNAAKQNWSNCHPKVPRLPGDPQSNPSQCDENAFGGGGTGTPSGGGTGGTPVTGICNLYQSGQAAPDG